MADDEVNPFESLQEQIDDAAVFLDADSDVLEPLKHPERESTSGSKPWDCGS
jgi:glutamate dehydrogenase (NAD(P)+)